MSQNTDPGLPWDTQAARTLYNIDRWGAKYFDVNEDGHVVATPLQDKGAAVDITDVIEEAKGRGAAILGIFHDEGARDRVCDRLVDVTAFTPPRATESAA